VTFIAQITDKIQLFSDFGKSAFKFACPFHYYCEIKGLCIQFVQYIHVGYITTFFCFVRHLWKVSPVLLSNTARYYTWCANKTAPTITY